MKNIGILFVGLFITMASVAQSNRLMAIRIDGADTLLYSQLPAVTIYGFTNPQREKQFSKLRADVIKVYPYAKLGASLLNSYHDSIQLAKSDKEVQRFYKLVEIQLKQQYGNEIAKLNKRQGLLLIKLIDRETNQTAYNIVSNSRNIIVASAYQGIARLWGYNLKTQYDPITESDIESIIKEIYRS